MRGRDERMKRHGIALALLVLFCVFSIPGISATTWENTGIYVKIGSSTVLMPVLTYDYAKGGYYFGYWAKSRQSFEITLILTNGTNITVTEADFASSSVDAADGYKVYLEKLNIQISEGQIKAVQWHEFGGTAFTEEFGVIYGGIKTYVLDDNNVRTFSISPYDGVIGYVAHAYTDWGTTKAGSIKVDGNTISGPDYNFNLIKFVKDAPSSSVGIARVSGLTTGVIVAFGDYLFRTVTFNIKDASTGQSLSGVTVKEGNTVLGTVEDGQSLDLAKGTHNLTFEKSGYWSVTKTINVQSDTSVSIEMYPSSVAFKFLNFPSDIEVYENIIYELTFTISPIDTSVTYNTYLSIGGLSNIIEVKKAGQVITPESGKYYLGDISSDTQVSIKFKAGSIGTHSFTITLTSNDAIMSSTYITSKQVAYTVNPLPFSVQMPSEWQVGTNELRISESSGQSILITAILKDANDTEVWSDSASLDPYAAHTFNVNVPSEGDYTLELQFNGQTASWDITVNPAITLLTETVTASEGDIATVQVKINNPSSNTKYYTIVLEGPIIEGNVSKSVSVAPLSEKTVDVSFQVPNELEYDAYDLNVKVYEGDALQYSDIVHLVIDNSGFSLPFFGGGSSSSIDSTWLWLGAGVLALFIFVMALRRR